MIDVFADVACPFAHVGLHRFGAHRQGRGETAPTLRVRAWPLELVNHRPHDGSSLTPKVAALRANVAPDLFAGFDTDRFPTSSLPAMAAEAAARRVDVLVGERFSCAVRHALFEDGLDISDPDVLRVLLDAHGVPDVVNADRASVSADLEEGRSRGVSGSPHFFTADGDFFCPSLDIVNEGDDYDVSFDSDGFQTFVEAAFD